MSNTQSNQPIAQVKVGTILASIWANENDEGAVRHSVQFQRMYRKDEKWHYTDSFGRDQLLTLAKAADLAHSKILELQEAA